MTSRGSWTTVGTLSPKTIPLVTITLWREILMVGHWGHIGPCRTSLIATLIGMLSGQNISRCSCVLMGVAVVLSFRKAAKIRLASFDV